MQDGHFRCRSMPVGMHATPGWLYYIIKSVLDTSGVDATNAFLDYIMVGGRVADWRLWWEVTLRVMYTEARFRFMLNLHKCKFSVRGTAILGFELCR